MIDHDPIDFPRTRAAAMIGNHQVGAQEPGEAKMGCGFE